MTLRRDFLGFTAGAVAARTILPAAVRAQPVPFVHAMSPEHPDAALIGACMAFMAFEAYAQSADLDDDAAEVARTRWSDAFDAAIALRPKTLIGLKAKARVVMAGFDQGVVASPGGTMEQEGEWHELAAWRLMQDVMLLGAA